MHREVTWSRGQAVGEGRLPLAEDVVASSLVSSFAQKREAMLSLGTADASAV